MPKKPGQIIKLQKNFNYSKTLFNLKRLHGLDFDKKDIKEPIIFAKTIKNPVRYYVEPIIPRVILRCGGISSNLAKEIAEETNDSDVRDGK
ncbi:MAG: hypothetical protein EZS28_011518 [Streblomastix strix]|uniref:Uncharacterized protein n=1 Tax=Streblomastix strix TaxID=222440 RepID=A0A5J4WE53_9EUKA|nr:MAG: hypothetical protein EZS28_011518 [Streblomastix strix]